MSAADLTLMHYSDTPIALDRDRTYAQDDLKPRGLWVSVPGEDDWPQWCRREEFRVDTLAHEHRVRLTPTANVLLLDDPDAVRTLRRQYPDHSSELASLRDTVDWAGVAADFDGIVIAPYQWSCRLDYDTFWYYGWDCASGCIWNLDAIESLSLVRSEQAAS